MEAIFTKNAPAAIGTYSQAIKSGDMVFISGQIPLDPENMSLCSDEILPQIEQCFKNLKAVSEAAGGSLSHIVKINVYLTDLTHFPLVNEVMSHYFTEPYPARAALGVSALPRNAQVEVEAIMILNTLGKDS